MSGSTPQRGLAVVLRLDPAAEAVLAPVCRGLPWPPHLTLAVLDELVPDGPLSRTLAGLAAGWAPVPVRLASLGTFPGGIAFLAPVPTPALLACHAALLAALGPDAESVHPHHRAGAWVPHVTVADPEAALALLPRVAMLDTVELVRFPPASSRSRHALEGRAGSIGRAG